MLRAFFVPAAENLAPPAGFQPAMFCKAPIWLTTRSCRADDRSRRPQFAKEAYEVALREKARTGGHFPPPPVPGLPSVRDPAPGASGGPPKGPEKFRI